jgi:hypothetical protein
MLGNQSCGRSPVQMGEFSQRNRISIAPTLFRFEWGWKVQRVRDGLIQAQQGAGELDCAWVPWMSSMWHDPDGSGITRVSHWKEAPTLALI